MTKKSERSRKSILSMNAHTPRDPPNSFTAYWTGGSSQSDEEVHRSCFEGTRKESRCSRWIPAQMPMKRYLPSTSHVC